MCLPKSPKPQKAFLPPPPAPMLDQDAPRAATAGDDEKVSDRKTRGTKRYGQPLQIGGVSNSGTAMGANNPTIGGV